MKISLIAAMSRGRIIGNQGRLPWPRISADLAMFRRETLGKVVIMGRKTFDDICVMNGGPLGGRISVVLSQSITTLSDKCFVASSKDEALRLAHIVGCGTEEIMVIGGASVFEQFISDAHRLYLTFIDCKFHGDATFPEIDHQKWRPLQISHLDDSPHQVKLKFITFVRK